MLQSDISRVLKAWKDRNPPNTNPPPDSIGMSRPPMPKGPALVKMCLRSCLSHGANK